MKIMLPVFDGRVPTEISGDYILPDTYPDVKRILRVRARPMMIGRYISGNRLEYNGATDYIVTFSADTEGGESLHSVHFAGEWNGAVGELDDLDACEIAIAPRITACSVRLANPRKLSIRSTVAADVKVARPTACEPTISGALTMEEEMRLERLTEAFPILREHTLLAGSQQISENLEPDASQPAIDEIITCDADIHLWEAKPQRTADGLSAAVKGEALIDCIYKAQSESGVWRSFQRKIPLSFIVPAEECEAYFGSCPIDAIQAAATGCLTELGVGVGDNSYGERRVLELDMAFDVTLRLCGSDTAELTLDAYSTERKSECAMRELELLAPAKMISSNFSVGESVPREQLNLPENAFIIDASAEAVIRSAAVERGRVVLSGDAAVSCILHDGAGFSSADVTLPIRCELNAGEISEPLAFCCDCTVSDMRARLDAGRLACDFEVSLNAQFCEKRRVLAAAAVALSGEPRAAAASAGMTLCYPGSDESMWDVAKRYAVSRAAIEAANRAGGRVILIPGGGIAKIV